MILTFLLLNGKGKLKNYYSSALGAEGEANAVEHFKMVICFEEKLRALTKGEWGLKKSRQKYLRNSLNDA